MNGEVFWMKAESLDGDSPQGGLRRAAEIKERPHHILYVLSSPSVWFFSVTRHQMLQPNQMVMPTFSSS